MVPSFEKQITTKQDILDSGLPFDWVLFGLDTEVYVSQSEDPVLSEIWKRKRVRAYSPDQTSRVMRSLKTVNWAYKLLNSILLV